MSVKDIKLALGSRWRCDQRLSSTTLFIHDQDPHADRLLPPLNAYPYQHNYTEYNSVLVVQTLIKRIKFGGSLCRICFGQLDLLTGTAYSSTCYYRYQPTMYRMMQLLVEPPVPKDVLRHIYSFIRK